MSDYLVGKAQYQRLEHKYIRERPPYKFDIEYGYIYAMLVTFFAQSKEPNSEVYVCSCMKKSIINFLEIQVKFGNFMGPATPLDYNFFSLPLANKSINYYDDPIKAISFKDKICPRCLGLIIGPKSLLFHSYVEQYIYEKGISFFHNKYLDFCPETYKEIIDHNKEKSEFYSKKLIKKGYSTEEMYNKLTSDEKEDYYRVNKTYYNFKKSFENDMRIIMGFKKIGEGLVGESTLFKILDKIFNENIRIKHYRQDVLEGLEIDYYISDLRIGIEFQGKQHFEPIEHFGGKEAYKKQIERDNMKKEICEKLGIKLLFVNYYDVIEESQVSSLLNEQLEIKYSTNLLLLTTAST